MLDIRFIVDSGFQCEDEAYHLLVVVMVVVGCRTIQEVDAVERVCQLSLSSTYDTEISPLD